MSRAIEKAAVPVESVLPRIVLLRGQKVLLDADLALLYGVPTGHLNRAVKRNCARFPSDFMFQTSSEESKFLKCQIGISKNARGGRRHFPYAFTEQGVAMLSSVLNSERAVQVNIAIMRAFVKLREILTTNQDLARKFDELEKRVGNHDEQIMGILDAIREMLAPLAPETRREIGFHVVEKSSIGQRNRKAHSK